MSKQTIVVIVILLVAFSISVYYYLEYLNEQKEREFKQQQLAGLQSWELPETGGGFLKILGIVPALFGVPIIGK